MDKDAKEIKSQENDELGQKLLEKMKTEQVPEYLIYTVMDCHGNKISIQCTELKLLVNQDSDKSPTLIFIFNDKLVARFEKWDYYIFTPVGK